LFGFSPFLLVGKPLPKNKIKVSGINSVHMSSMYIYMALFTTSEIKLPYMCNF